MHRCSYEVKPTTAIVAEGGGQRGIYTAGILDVLLEEALNPFDLGCGVSAGAQNLLTYFLGEHGYAKRAIAELTARPDFLVPYRWLMDRSVLDLDGYFERTLRDPEYRLPYQRISSLGAQRRLIFVATEKDSLDPVYLEPDESTVLNYLKASSAVPFLYKDGVAFGDRLLVDGGVADPLPIRHAYEQGARRILLIRTVPVMVPDARLSGDTFIWRQRLERARRFSATPFKVMQMLERHEQVLHQSLAFINDPPDDLELTVVSPQSALSSLVFGSRSEALISDYEQGRADGHRLIPTVQGWLSDPAVTHTP